MRIYLVGMPGSGKTTLGKALAKALQLPFLDLDASLEISERTPIPEIFASKGEDYFREKEAKTLQSTAKMDNAVFATGGGAPCFFDNMDFMNQHGLTIYFKISAHELAARLEKSQNRPVLKNDGGEELVQELEEKSAQREKYYAQAKVTVEGDQLMVDDVLELLEGHL